MQVEISNAPTDSEWTMCIQMYTVCDETKAIIKKFFKDIFLGYAETNTEPCKYTLEDLSFFKSKELIVGTISHELILHPPRISRLLSAVAVTVYCFQKQNEARYRVADIFAWDSNLLKKVMGIALPNGVENGEHQLVKVALSSMVALFGTYQIAANGVAQSIWSLGNGLRAAGDVKFTMIVSITLTIAARLLFSALFGLWLGWGVIGVAIGMSMDLVFRGAIFIWRLRSQKWTQFQLI